MATPQIETQPTYEAEVIETIELYTALSSGVKVQFKLLPQSISQEIMVDVFQNTKLDAKGNILESKSQTDNIALAGRVLEYHSKLISFACSLYGDISDYIDLPTVGKNWLRKLVRGKMIDTDLYDLEDIDDLEFIFMRYYAFVNEDDWRILSERALGNQGK